MDADFRQPNRIDLRSRDDSSGFSSLFAEWQPTLADVLGDGWQIGNEPTGVTNSAALFVILI